MKSIADNINLVRQRINNAKKKAGRSEQPILLLAISKTKSAAHVREAWAAGLKHFGENYVQEAQGKLAELADLDLSWHFTGPIQTNKTRWIAEHCTWAHTIDRLKIAQRLSNQRPMEQQPLNVCIQININSEAAKAGIKPTELADMAKQINALPRLKLRGLMCLPDPRQTELELHQTFANMRKLFEQTAQSLPDMDTLSMGMSRDLETAILEGSTLVRVGTDIFGPRQK